MDPRGTQGSWTDLYTAGPGLGCRRGLASVLPSLPDVVRQVECMSAAQTLTDMVAAPVPKQYKLPPLPCWFLDLNSELLGHVRSFLCFDEKLILCEVCKALNMPQPVKLWRTGYGKNRLRYSLPPFGCLSGVLCVPTSEKQRLLQAVVKIQRYWISRALRPVFHFKILKHEELYEMETLPFFARGSDSQDVIYSFDRLGLRMLVRDCLDTYEQSSSFVSAPLADFIGQHDLSPMNPTDVKNATFLDKPTLQRYLLFQMFGYINQPVTTDSPFFGGISFYRLRFFCGTQQFTRKNHRITMAMRGRAAKYSKMLGVGTKINGLSNRHLPGGSRRQHLFYKGYGGMLYAPLSYSWARNRFYNVHSLHNYDPRSDSFIDHVCPTLAPPGKEYAYMTSQELAVHKQTGTWSKKQQLSWADDADIPVKHTFQF
jgi:hypothetical protein